MGLYIEKPINSNSNSNRNSNRQIKDLFNL